MPNTFKVGDKVRVRTNYKEELDKWFPQYANPLVVTSVFEDWIYFGGARKYHYSEFELVPERSPVEDFLNQKNWNSDIGHDVSQGKYLVINTANGDFWFFDTLEEAEDWLNQFSSLPLVVFKQLSIEKETILHLEG